jgi:putative ubiquitin-RnfH superfamily antitoxin RatB of RatAB toxin-antitoxin module
MATRSDRIAVRVAYATPEEQVTIAIYVPWGATVQEAIEISGLLDRFQDLDLAVNRVGIFGRLRRLDDVVKAGERIEIYRPLRADPKEARRRRAAARTVPVPRP